MSRQSRFVPRSLSGGEIGRSSSRGASYATTATAGLSSTRPASSSGLRQPSVPFSIEADYAVAYTIPSTGLTQQKLTQAFQDAHPSLRFQTSSPRPDSFIVKLISAEDLNLVLQSCLPVEDLSFSPYPLHSVNPSLGLFSLRVSNVPFGSLADNEEALRIGLADFGEVLHAKEEADVVKNCSTGIFHIILKVPQEIVKLPPQALEIVWKGRKSILSVTPDSTPTFCSYCRSKDHLRSTCQAPPPCHYCGLQTHGPLRCRQHKTPESTREARFSEYRAKHKAEHDAAAELRRAAQLDEAKKTAARAEAFAKELALHKQRTAEALRASEAAENYARKAKGKIQGIRSSLPNQTSGSAPNTLSFDYPTTHKRRSKAISPISNTHQYLNIKDGAPIEVAAINFLGKGNSPPVRGQATAENERSDLSVSAHAPNLPSESSARMQGTGSSSQSQEAPTIICPQPASLAPALDADSVKASADIELADAYHGNSLHDSNGNGAQEEPPSSESPVSDSY